MKRIIVVLALTFAYGTFLMNTSFAEQSVGCGLGDMFIKKNSLVSTTTRAITNWIFSNQTFGMSSGTSGCTQHSIVKNEMAPIYYAEANLENLKVEMAQGSGENLMAFADTLGCGQNAKATFMQTTQKEYEQIFKSGNENAEEVIGNLNAVIKKSSLLSAQCSNA